MPVSGFVVYYSPIFLVNPLLSSTLGPASVSEKPIDLSLLN